MNDEWFADEEKVRRVVGLLEEPRALPNVKEVNINNLRAIDFLCFTLPLLTVHLFLAVDMWDLL